MKKYLTPCVFVLGVFFITSTAQAKDRTCAEKMRQYRTEAIAVSVGIPVSGWLVGAMCGPGLIKQYHDILRLEAATILTNKIYNAEIITKAHLIIDDFYQKLTRTYPTMTLAKADVIDVLHRYNIYSPKYGRCVLVGDRLINTLFPNQQTDKYLKIDREWHAQQEEKKKQIAEAAKIRNQKNVDEDIRYFADI